MRRCPPPNTSLKLSPDLNPEKKTFLIFSDSLNLTSRLSDSHSHRIGKIKVCLLSVGGYGVYTFLLFFNSTVPFVV